MTVSHRSQSGTAKIGNVCKGAVADRCRIHAEYAPQAEDLIVVEIQIGGAQGWRLWEAMPKHGQGRNTLELAWRVTHDDSSSLVQGARVTGNCGGATMSRERGFPIKLRLPSLDSCDRHSLLAAFDGLDGECV